MSIIIDESKEIIKNINFSQLNNKKILITGASGLIGVYLVSCLKQIMKTHNIDIFVWVQNDIDIIFSDIFHDCTIIKNDITDISSFLKLPEFDCIIHAAGYGQPDKFMDDKIKTISLNTTSTIELFNKLKTNGKFLFISTSELYSGIDEQNITEIQIGTTKSIFNCSNDLSTKNGAMVCTIGIKPTDDKPDDKLTVDCSNIPILYTLLGYSLNDSLKPKTPISPSNKTVFSSLDKRWLTDLINCFLILINQVLI